MDQSLKVKFLYPHDGNAEHIVNAEIATIEREGGKVKDIKMSYSPQTKLNENSSDYHNIMILYYPAGEPEAIQADAEPAQPTRRVLAISGLLTDSPEVDILRPWNESDSVVGALENVFSGAAHFEYADLILSVQGQPEPGAPTVTVIKSRVL